MLKGVVYNYQNAMCVSLDVFEAHFSELTLNYAHILNLSWYISNTALFLQRMTTYFKIKSKIKFLRFIIRIKETIGELNPHSAWRKILSKI